MFNQAIHLLNFITILLLFLISYILYRVFRFAMEKMAKTPLARRVVKNLHRPILALFMEATALIALYFFETNEKLTHFFHSFILVLIVLTVGLLVALITHNLFLHVIEIYKKDPKRRSSVVQIQFCYRLVLIAIGILTLGGLLLLFPTAKHLGVGLLGSAGVVGLVVGMAARPIFLNLMAGLQIAMNKTINLDDGLMINGEFCRVESIHLTYVVVVSWDLKRNVIPISDFIDKSFQNMDLFHKEKIGTVFLYVDYKTPVETLRKKFEEIVEGCPFYNGRLNKLQVYEMTEHTMQLRLLMSADDAPTTLELKCYVREKLIEFLQKEHPYALPMVRELLLKE